MSRKLSNKMANSSEEVHSKLEAEEGIEESQGFMDFQDTKEFQRRGLGKEELKGSVLDDQKEEEAEAAANIETKEQQDLEEEGSLSPSKVDKECQDQDESMKLIGGDEPAKVQEESEIEEEHVHSYQDPDELTSFQSDSNNHLEPEPESMTKSSQQEEKLDASSGKRKHMINEEASGKKVKVSEE